MLENMENLSDLSSNENKREEKLSTVIAFCIAAILTYVFSFVLLSGAEDILADTQIQTSTVLLVEFGPYTIMTFTLPYFAKRIPYVVRLCFGCLCVTTAFLILGITHDVNSRLFGAALESIGTGIIDVSIVSLGSYFGKSVFAAYSTGTGAGCLVGPLYYAALTTWICVSPNFTFLILAPMSIVCLLCFYVIKRDITTEEKNKANRSAIAYSMLNSSDDEDKEDDTEKKDSQHRVQRFSCPETLTWKEKLLVVKRILILVGIPAFIAFAAEYISFQSVITTLAYANSPFTPRNHYQYYFVALMVGEVLGRAHRSLLGAIKSNLLYTPTLKGVWLLTIIEVIHLVFFLFESWYRFLPGIGVIVSLCFTMGITIGAFYCNCLEFIRVQFDQKEQEFVFGVALFPGNSGIVAASILGLYVERSLKEHCYANVKERSYCWTRIVNQQNSAAVCKVK